MASPTGPVTLSVQQLEELTKKLATLRHDVNNHLLLVTGRSPGAESDPDLVPPRPHPNVEQLRERAAKMSPEERQRFIRELQERRGLTGTNRPEAAVRREEFRKLTPEERAARVREFRQRLEKGQPRYHVMTPEERE